MTTKRIRNKLEYLVHHTGCAEADIRELAFEKGLDDLYRQELSDAYLRGDIDRSRAISELGKDTVAELDYARAAVEADVKWGLQGA